MIILDTKVISEPMKINGVKQRAELST